MNFVDKVRPKELIIRSIYYMRRC